MVGERGIMDELAAAGIMSCGGPDDNGKAASFSLEMQQDTSVGAVVCGVDPGLSYYKVSRLLSVKSLYRTGHHQQAQPALKAQCAIQWALLCL